MRLNLVNILLITRLMMKRLLRRFLLLLLLLLTTLYLLFTYSHLLNSTSLFSEDDVNHLYGRGRVSSSSRHSIQNPVRKTKPFLAICILSGPSNSAQRQAARDTWMKLIQGPEYDQVIPLFVLGSRGLDEKVSDALRREMEAFHDLLLLDDLIDSYANLTLKIVHAYSWIDRHLKPNYVLKMDDDSFSRGSPRRRIKKWPLVRRRAALLGLLRRPSSTV